MPSNEIVKDEINGIEKATDSEEHISSSEESEDDTKPPGDDHSMARYCQLLAGTEELYTLWSENLEITADYACRKFDAEETGQEFQETLDPCLLCLFCKEGQPCCRFPLLESCRCLKIGKSIGEAENNPPTNES